MFLLLAALVFHNATVIDGTGAPPRPHTDVVIRADRIERVCDAATCEHPADADVIDATGKYLIPGLIDMHAHVLIRTTDEKGEVAARVDRAATLQMLRMLVDFGVTTVRDPGATTEEAINLRRLLAEGKIEGPTLFTAGRIINSSEFNPEPFQPVHNADEVRAEIRWQALCGVDVIKIYSSMKPELTKVAIEEAHAHGLPIIGHLQLTTWTIAANLGIDGVEHAASWSPEYVRAEDRAAYPNSMAGRIFWIEHLDDAAIGEMATAMATHHVVYDPTLMAMRTKLWGDDPRYTQNPDLRFAPEALRKTWAGASFTKSFTAADYAEGKKAWPTLLALTKRLYDAGVPMVTGTDTATPWIIPGASLHEELTLLRDAGIPPLEILRMATSGGATALHREKEFGAIREGLRADLVLLRGDPLQRLENTRSIDTVVQRGRIVSHGPTAK